MLAVNSLLVDSTIVKSKRARKWVEEQENK